MLLGFVGANCEGPLPLALSPSLTHSPFPPRLSSNRTCGFPASGSRTDFTWGIQRRRLRFGLHVELLLKLFELCRGCQAHANLPLVHSSRSTLNQGPFPPRSLPASQVLWAPPTPVRATPSRRVRSSPRSHRPPVLRTPPLHACRAHYPGGPPGLVDCFHPALRPSPYLGRVGTHVSPLGTCSGFTRVAAYVLARPPFGGLLLRGFGSGSRPPSPPDGFRGASTIPRAGLSPAGDSAPFTAHPNPENT